MRSLVVISLLLNYIDFVISADPVTNNTSRILPTAASAPLDLFGILGSLGMTRQTEVAIFSQILSSFLGLLATGKVVPFIAPLIISYLILPLMKIIKTVAKALVLIGIIGWLLSSLVPMIITYFGLTGPGAFVSRAFQSATPFFNTADVTISRIADRGFDYLKLNNRECKLMLSCKAGEFMISNYPSLTNSMVRFGIVGYLEANNRDSSPLTLLALNALQGKTSCERDLNPCQSFHSIESMFNSNEVFGTNSLLQTFTSTQTPPTISSTILPIYNDLVANTVRRIASNYYNQNATNWYNV